MFWLTRLFSCFILCCGAIAYADDNSQVDILKAYLKSLSSVAIDFTQVDSHGGQAVGKLVIVKPDKFLCNYYAPYPLLIVGNKSYVSLYDYDLEQVTRVGVDENLFSFLLTDRGNIEEQFDIENVYDGKDSFIVDLHHKASERKTVVNFNRKENRLESIITYEPDGTIITLNITHIDHIKNPASTIFVLQNPEVYGIPKRLSKEDIEKKYQIVK